MSIIKITVQFFSVVVIFLLLPYQASSETKRFNVTRDVWISAYPGEENFNMGATPKLKLKGIQEIKRRKRFVKCIIRLTRDYLF